MIENTERIKELLEKRQKEGLTRVEVRELLADGIYIRKAQVVDFVNHEDRNANLRTDRVKMDNSMFAEEIFLDNRFNLELKDNKLYSNDILSISASMNQISVEEQLKKAKKRQGSELEKAKEQLKKALAEREKLNDVKVIENLQEEYNKIDREHKRIRKSISRCSKTINDENATEDVKLKATKKLEEETKKLEDVKIRKKQAKDNLNKTAIDKEIKKLENKVKSLENGTTNIKERLKNVEELSTDINTTATDAIKLRERAIEKGLTETLDKVEYSDRLKRKLTSIKTQYKKDKAKELGVDKITNNDLTDEDLVEIKKLQQAEIDSRPNEVHITKVTYTKSPTAPSKGRKGDCLYVKNKVTRNDKVIYDGLNDEINDKLSYGAYSKMKEIHKADPTVKQDIVTVDTVSSLTQSSCVDHITDIKSNNILVLKDVECEVASNVANVYLENNELRVENISAKDGGKDVNVLFDGQCLIDNSVMPLNEKGEHVATALLRQDGFKSNGINTNIQKFMRDKYKELHNGSLDGFDKWQLTDAYGNKVYAKDVLLITTNNSTKFDKLANLLTNNNKAEMYKLFCKSVDEKGFGVVSKGGHSSKYGELQRMSYQIANTINFGNTKEEIEKNMKEFVKTSMDYLNGMKEHDELFIDYLKVTANEMNGHQDMINILTINKEFANTPLFRNFKADKLRDLKEDIMAGKFMIEGDNVVVASMPYSMLEHSVGELPVSDGMLIKDKFKNEFGSDNKYMNVYCKRFKEDEILTHMRSPHSNEASFVLGKNCESELIDKYFNVDDTVAFLDTTNHASASALGGQDYDNDHNLVSNNKKLRELVEEYSWGKKNVVVNKIPNKGTDIYTYSAKDRAYKDWVTSNNGIGDIANFSQIVNSQIQHYKRNGVPQEVLDRCGNMSDEEIIAKMEDLASMSTNGMNLAIDNAKRPSQLSLTDSWTTEGNVRRNDLDKQITNCKNRMKAKKITSEKLAKEKEILANLEAEKEALKEDTRYFEKGLISRVKDEPYWMKNETGSLIKPDFFIHVSSDKNVKTQAMDCDMDMLAKIVDETSINAPKVDRVNINKLLKPNGKYSKQRVNDTLKEIRETNTFITNLRAKAKLEKQDKDKRVYFDMINDEETLLVRKINQLKNNKGEKVTLTENDFNAILRQVFLDDTDIITLTIKTLNKVDKDKFLGVFQKGESLNSFTDEAINKADDYVEELDGIINKAIQEQHEELDKLAKDIKKDVLVELHNLSEEEANKLVEERISEFKETSIDLQKDLYTRIMKDSYSKFMFAQSNIVGVVFNFEMINQHTIDKILTTPFAGGKFNDRMGNMCDAYAEDIRKVMKKGFDEGLSYYNMSKELEELTEHSRYACVRLLRTEGTNFANQGEIEAMKELDIDRYVYVATLDSRTSSVCRDMDGKVLYVSDAKTGENLPPLHPHCRSTVIPYYSQGVLTNMKRRAKNGKSYVLNKHITYKEWDKLVQE